MANQHTSDTKQRVIRYLRRCKWPRTTAEIARGTGLGVGQVGNCLRRGENPFNGDFALLVKAPRRCQVNRRMAFPWRLLRR